MDAAANVHGDPRAQDLVSLETVINDTRNFTIAQERAVVQTIGINAMKRSGTLRGSCRENSIPNFGRSFAVDAKLAKFELTFPDPVHQFDASDGN